MKSITIIFLTAYSCLCCSPSTSSSNPNIIDNYFYVNPSSIEINKTLKNTIDTGPFKVNFPNEWKLKKGQGIDSFVGEITNDKYKLSFSYSTQGNSYFLTSDTINHLITEDTITPFYVKIVSPKNNKKGTTGIYLINFDYSTSLNLYGKDLLPKTNKEVLKAFQTIGIKLSENLP